MFLGSRYLDTSFLTSKHHFGCIFKPPKKHHRTNKKNVTFSKSTNLQPHPVGPSLANAWSREETVRGFLKATKHLYINALLCANVFNKHENEHQHTTSWSERTKNDQFLFILDVQIFKWIELICLRLLCQFFPDSTCIISASDHQQIFASLHRLKPFATNKQPGPCPYALMYGISTYISLKFIVGV